MQVKYTSVRRYTKEEVLNPAPLLDSRQNFVYHA